MTTITAINNREDSIEFLWQYLENPEDPLALMTDALSHLDYHQLDWPAELSTNCGEHTYSTGKQTLAYLILCMEGEV